MTGRWAPDLVLVEHGRGLRRRLAELMRAGRPLLVDLTADGLPLPPTGRVEVVRGSSTTANIPAAMLIRPDGYVAWAADVLDAEVGTELTEALWRWFGVSSADPDDHVRLKPVGVR